MSATLVLLEERAALCDTFEKYGPEAPTLCEGWLTLDLAAHMAAREDRLDAAVGLVLVEGGDGSHGASSWHRGQRAA